MPHQTEPGCWSIGRKLDTHTVLNKDAYGLILKLAEGAAIIAAVLL